MKKIPLTQGRFALVDNEDYERISSFDWYFHDQKTGDGSGYALRSAGRRGATILMHHEVLGMKPAGVSKGSPEVDHRNLDKLDNRRSNLRIATRTLNSANKRKRPGWRGAAPASKFKGVARDRRPLAKPWRVRCGKKHAGYFATEEEAARAYNKAARKLYGEFARENVP